MSASTVPVIDGAARTGALDLRDQDAVDGGGHVRPGVPGQQRAQLVEAHSASEARPNEARNRGRIRQVRRSIVLSLVLVESASLCSPVLARTRAAPRMNRQVHHEGRDRHRRQLRHRAERRASRSPSAGSGVILTYSSSPEARAGDRRGHREGGRHGRRAAAGRRQERDLPGLPRVASSRRCATRGSGTRSTSWSTTPDSAEMAPVRGHHRGDVRRVHAGPAQGAVLPDPDPAAAAGRRRRHRQHEQQLRVCRTAPSPATPPTPR